MISGGSERLRRSRLILWIIAVCIAAPLLQEQLILATLPVSRADNEGWNAYHALASTSPSALYPDPRSLVQNNYPPLSFYVTRWLAPQGGDVLMAGRLLSVLGLLLAAFGASRVAKHAGAGSVGMLAIPIAIALAAGAPFGGYVGMNDPQWFGHGLQLLGVSLCFTRSRAGVVLAALLMSAGVLCKQLLVVLPLATFAAFILANRMQCHGVRGNRVGRRHAFDWVALDGVRPLWTRLGGWIAHGCVVSRA